MEAVLNIRVNSNKNLTALGAIVGMKRSHDNLPGHQIARMIDHTLLKPERTHTDIIRCCHEALAYEFRTVCVHPHWVQTVAKELQGSTVGVTTVVGFPLGMTTTTVKMAEAHNAVMNGATEIDMVINMGALKSGDWSFVQRDIEGVVSSVDNKTIVKVIIETGYLTEEEKKTASRTVKMAGAHFVKTSTGFGPGRATLEDVRLIRETVGQHFGIKASGGIRDLESAQQFIQAGADRIGTSSGVLIVNGKTGEGY